MQRENRKPELYQGCLRKISYKTYHAAEIGAKEKEAKYKVEYDIYWCKYCNRYHLSTKKEYKKEVQN